jgi:hypothetical protein
MFAAGAIWAVLLIGLTGLLGIVVAVSDHPPRDPLHLVYGLLAATTLPGAYVVARGRRPATRPVVWAIAGIILVILVLRLFQTGG